MRLGEAEYQFPDLCSVLHEEANCSAAHNMTVGLQSINWPTLLYVSATTGVPATIFQGSVSNSVIDKSDA